MRASISTGPDRSVIIGVMPDTIDGGRIDAATAARVPAPRSPLVLDSRLLIDVGPATGAHGERGIGRYVRGLVASIGSFPTDLADRIWATGGPGTLEEFGPRGLPAGSRRSLSMVPAWAQARFVVGAAVARSGAAVLHATDPQRSWTPGSVPALVTVYDLIPLHEPETLRSWRFDHRSLYRWYLRQVRSATRVLAISETTAQDLEERIGVPRSRIDVVYPVVEARSRLARIDADEPTFLVVGAPDPHKQPELAIQAFARFRATTGSGRLRFVGPSDPARERTFLELADRLRVASAISFEGRIPDVDLEAAYASASAVLSTSRIEGFGLPAVEAVLRGVPVIAVETPAARETLEGAATLVPADADAIATAMASPTQPEEARIEAIRERYSLGSVARSLADVYRGVLD